MPRPSLFGLPTDSVISSDMTTTRRCLLLSAAVLAAAAGGCGFRLRGHFTLPFHSLYIALNPNSPLASGIKRRLEGGSSVKILPTMQNADAILQITVSTRSRRAVSLNVDGRAREYELTLRIGFRVVAPDGFSFVPETVIEARRLLTYSVDRYLSRGDEEAILYSEMQSDITDQMIRMIEKASPRPAVKKERLPRRPLPGDAPVQETGPISGERAREMGLGIRPGTAVR